MAAAKKQPMSAQGIATLALTVAAALCGALGFPASWALINLALVATFAGMVAARGKFAGVTLRRTLMITLSAFVANALVAAVAFVAGGYLVAAFWALRSTGAPG